MNCPSRTDPEVPDTWNQSPSALDLHSNQDMNGLANLRHSRDHIIASEQPPDHEISPESRDSEHAPPSYNKSGPMKVNKAPIGGAGEPPRWSDASSPRPAPRALAYVGNMLRPSWHIVKKFARFVGPGFMISVAYIDPGNYATDVAAGATYRFQLLVMILVSNLIAIFLQTLCIKLGSVTGLNLAENCRAHFPPWLNYVLWFLAESAIIATDVAEVIGTAIALNLLLHIPLVAGCAISIVDVLIILIFYRPSGTMRGLRVFELFVMLLVLGVVVCFCIELSLLNVPNVGEIFRGYLPSKVLVESQGLYQACGILGATVMPHSLYLGSGIVQPRLREWDEAHGNVMPLQPARRSSTAQVVSALTNTSSSTASTASPPYYDDDEPPKYKPSLAAIKSCMSMSIFELALSLFTFALFVNSAILIVAGASLSSDDGSAAASADLFGIHDLLSSTIAPGAGTVFALALLLSGTSAGIVCTIAGQMVAEGQLRWSVKPWVRRLMTRSISITPSIIIAGAVGRSGLSAALEGSQVALSVILPFTSAPLIYFTCRNKFMTVDNGTEAGVGMRNNWFVIGLGVALWLLIVVMNVALLVLVGLGQG